MRPNARESSAVSVGRLVGGGELGQTKESSTRQFRTSVQINRTHIVGNKSPLQVVQYFRMHTRPALLSKQTVSLVNYGYYVTAVTLQRYLAAMATAAGAPGGPIH